LYTNLAASIAILNVKSYTPTEARQKISKYCAYQERCHQEVRDKLYSFKLSKDDVELIIYELIQQDFLNEERFAKAFTRGKFRYKKWGRNKIRMELERRKISSYCIKKSFEEISSDQYNQVLYNILEKKIYSIKNLKTFQKNYKAAQFAIGKGYEPSLVWDVLRHKFSNQ